MRCPGFANKHHVQGTFVLLPVGTVYHGTPKQYWIGTVLYNHSRASRHNRQKERAIHPHA
jgi:hypothetical protein